MKHFIKVVFILMAVLFWTIGSGVKSFAGSQTPTVTAASTDQKLITGDAKVKKLPAIKSTPRLKSDHKPALSLKPPDLTIKAMKIVPANPTTLDTIRFSAFVHNAGIATAPASKAGIKIGGETYPVIFAKLDIPGGSSSAIVRFLKIGRPGTYWVKFIADVNNDVSESKERNNMGSLKFRVVKPALPDLAVVNITNNSNNCLVYTIKNLGGPIPSSVNRNFIGIRFIKNGGEYGITNLNIADPNCNLCQPNGTVTGTQCHIGSTTGPWFDYNITAKVEVDYTNKLEEPDESNNSMEEHTLAQTSPYGG